MINIRNKLRKSKRSPSIGDISFVQRNNDCGIIFHYNCIYGKNEFSNHLSQFFFSSKQNSYSRSQSVLSLNWISTLKSPILSLSRNTSDKSRLQKCKKIPNKKVYQIHKWELFDKLPPILIESSKTLLPDFLIDGNLNKSNET